MADAITKTYREIANFDAEARQWLDNNERKWRASDEGNKNRAYPGTKFTYAIKRVLKRAQDILGEYQEKVTEIAIRHAAVDDKGVLATDDRGQFRFKPDELIKRNKEQGDLFRSGVEIEPYHATYVPDDLSEEEKELFADFVIEVPVEEKS